jgi:CheY-like chemotaxis protein
MILVVTPVAKVQECAAAIQEATQEGVQVAPSLRQALTLLRTQEYSAVLFDQTFEETEPDDSEMALERLGMAIPVHLSFAISKMDRVVREVRAALQRRKKEVKLARQGAQQALRNELKGTVTALLLSCEMALQVPNLQEAAEAKMRAVYDLAQEVRSKLDAPA